jgi:transcriptional regulator of nitric oxide reductase
MNTNQKIINSQVDKQSWEEKLEVVRKTCQYCFDKDENYKGTKVLYWKGSPKYGQSYKFVVEYTEAFTEASPSKLGLRMLVSGMTKKELYWNATEWAVISLLQGLK